MAKKTDPFEKFREATLSGGVSLGSALGNKNARNDEEPAAQAPVAEPQKVAEPQSAVVESKVGKNVDKELVSFHISKSMKKQLDLLKVESDKSLKELYTEAVADLLAKYGKTF
ncbi:MAG: hypothetical protein MJY72_06565 [Bacteroidales bacterium]|nr:hypothetical protein [Bacteroidales bacterium]